MISLPINEIEAWFVDFIDETYVDIEQNKPETNE